MKYQFLAALASIAHGTDVFCENTEIDPVHMLTDAQKMYMNFMNGEGTAEDCQTECKKFTGCDGFTFHAQNRICRLSTFALMAKMGVTYDQVFEKLEDDENYEGKTFGLKSGDANCVKKEPWKPIKVNLFNYSSTTRDNITWYQPEPLPADRISYYNEKCGSLDGVHQFRGNRPQCEGFNNCPFWVYNWPNCDATIVQLRPLRESIGAVDLLTITLILTAITYFASLYVCKALADLIKTNNGSIPMEYIEVKSLILMSLVVLYVSISVYGTAINSPPSYFALSYIPNSLRPMMVFFPQLQMVLIETRKTWKTFNDYGPIGYVECFFYFCLYTCNTICCFVWICTQYRWPAGFNLGFNTSGVLNHPLHPNALRYETTAERFSWLNYLQYFHYILNTVVVAVCAIFIVYAVYRNRDFWKIASSYIAYILFVGIWTPSRYSQMWGWYTMFEFLGKGWGWCETYQYMWTSDRFTPTSATLQNSGRNVYATGCYTFVAFICVALCKNLGLMTGDTKYWYSPDFGQRVKNYIRDSQVELMHFIFAVLTFMIPLYHIHNLFWFDPNIKHYITAVLFIGMISFATMYWFQEQTKEDFDDWSVAGLVRLSENLETIPSSMRILLKFKFVLFWVIMLISDNLLFLSGVFGGNMRWGSEVDLGFDLFNKMNASLEHSAWLKGGNMGIVQMRTDFFVTVALIYGINTFRLYMSQCTEAPTFITRHKKLYNIYLDFTDFSSIFFYVIMLFSSFRIMLRGFKCVDDVNNPGVYKVTWAYNYRCMRDSNDPHYPYITNFERHVVHMGFFVSFWFILFTSFRIVASRQKIKLPELTQNHFFIVYQTLSRLLLVLCAELLSSSPVAIIIIAFVLVIGHVGASSKLDVVVGLPQCTALYFAVYCAQFFIHLIALVNLGGLQGDSAAKVSSQDAAFIAAWILGVLAGVGGFFFRFKKDSNKNILDRVRVIKNVQWETGAIEPVDELEEETNRAAKAEITAALCESAEGDGEDLAVLPRDLNLWDIGAAFHTEACFAFMRNALDFKLVLEGAQDPLDVAMAMEGCQITKLSEETIMRSLRLFRRALRCDTGRHAVHFKKKLLAFPALFFRQKSLQIEAMIVLERLSRDTKNLNEMRVNCYGNVLRAWAQEEDAVFHSLAGLVLQRIGRGKRLILYNNRKDDCAPNYSSETLEHLNDEMVIYSTGGAFLTFVPTYPSIMGGRHVSLWHARGEIEDVASAHGGYNSSVHKFTSNDSAVDCICIFPPYNFLPANIVGGDLDAVRVTAIVGGRSNAVYLPGLLKTKENKEEGMGDMLKRNPLVDNFAVSQAYSIVSFYVKPLLNFYRVFSPPPDATNAKPDEEYIGFNEHWDGICFKALNSDSFEDTGRPTTNELYFLYFEEGPESEAGDGGHAKIQQSASKSVDDENPAIAELLAKKPAETKMLTPARSGVMSQKFLLLFRGKITPFTQTALFRSLDSARSSAVAAENFGLYKDQEKFKSYLSDNMDKKRRSCAELANSKGNRV